MFYANASENIFLLSGRLRISVNGLRGNGKLAERIHLLEGNARGIKKALANVYTGNALILFDEAAIGAPAVVGLIEQAMRQAQAGGDAHTAEFGSPLPKAAALSVPLLLAGAGLLALGGHSVLGGNGILPGAASLALAIPLAREGFAHWKQTHQIHYGLLLLPVALISLLMGKSAFGLLAALTGTATSLMERLFGRHRIRSEPPLKLESTRRVYRRLAPLAAIAAGMYLFATGNWVMALAMLVIAFPYMLSPAAKVTMRRAIRQGAAHGIFIRDPAKLEDLRRLTTVILGGDVLLTQDSYRVQSVISAESFNKNRLVALAASCLHDTGSPFAHALADEAKRRNTKLMPADRKESPGYVCGVIEGEEVYIGTSAQLHGKYAIPAGITLQEQKLLHLGQYPLLIAYGPKICGLVGLALGARDAGMQVVERLREAGVQDFWLLSGRDEALTAFIARSFGIDRWTLGAAREDGCAAMEKMSGEGQEAALLCPDDFDCAANGGLVIRVSNQDGESDRPADLSLAAAEAAAEAVDLAKYTWEKLAQNNIVSTGIDAVGLILLLTMNMSIYGALLYKAVGNGLLLAFADRSFRYFREHGGNSRASHAVVCAC